MLGGMRHAAAQFTCLIQTTRLHHLAIYRHAEAGRFRVAEQPRVPQVAHDGGHPVTGPGRRPLDHLQHTKPQ